VSTNTFTTSDFTPAPTEDQEELTERALAEARKELDRLTDAWDQQFDMNAAARALPQQMLVRRLETQLEDIRRAKENTRRISEREGLENEAYACAAAIDAAYDKAASNLEEALTLLETAATLRRQGQRLAQRIAKADGPVVTMPKRFFSRNPELLRKLKESSLLGDP